VTFADLLHPLCAVEQFARSGAIVVVGSRAWIGQDSAVEDSAGDDGDSALEAQRQQLAEPRLIEERVAASQQETVEVSLARKTHEHLRLVHPRADGMDRALSTEVIERSVCALDGVVVVVVGVVDVQDVDAVETQALQALFEGAHDAVVRKVEDRVDGRDAHESLSWFRRRARSQQPADLGRQDELVPRLAAQHRPEPLLGQAVAVQGRGVEEPDSSIPGRLDDSVRVLIGDGLIETAERCGPEAEASDTQSGAPELGALVGFQSSKILGRRSLLVPLKSCATAIMGAISACHRMLTGSVARSAMARS
jgi:hypothetical protein